MAERPIAIYLSALPLGSRERLIFAAVRALLELGRPVDLVSAGIPEGWAAAAPTGARIVDLAGWTRRPLARVNIARLVLGLPALMAYLNRERPAALLGMSIPPNLLALLARQLCRSETTLLLRQSNVIRIPGQPAYAGVRRRLRDPLIPLLYPGADGIIAVSDGVADNLARLLPKGCPVPVRVIPNHIVTADFARRAAEAVDDPWLDCPDSPCLVAVGRLVRKKDYPTLLQALAGLRQRCPVRLLIIGEGPERRTLVDQIERLGLTGHVRLLGRIDNPLPYLRRADGYVLASISEGMPSALLEAVACGCPAIATDCPSGPAEILAGGRHGRLVPVGNSHALAGAIEATLADPTARAAAAEHANSLRLAAGSSVEAYVDSLLEAASRSATPARV